MRKIRIVQLALIAFGALFWMHNPASAQTTIPDELAEATKACLECHAAGSHGIYQNGVPEALPRQGRLL
jgi:cytochrome c553